MSKQLKIQKIKVYNKNNQIFKIKNYQINMKSYLNSKLWINKNIIYNKTY
jgi:hypothetical protein